MKTTEWFICLDYGKYTFLIPHTYSTENGVVPEIFIDFDSIASDMFSIDNIAKHPVAITIKCCKTAMISTSAVPSITQKKLKDFHIPEGIIEENARETGIIAISFTSKGISVIVNPELLYERWSAEK
ncbi:hypothetical protein [Treponema sp.]|uniref:hypothetical protein n=1 Tax=Treponema sp. TaxID=166 RepID=UPI00298EC41F|nr:hypothetical protein [Treponema sp.]MCQ2240497.1 hypothetical protein [Treponema sp.]